MVRLKVIGIFYVEFNPLFQFQYGTIKRAQSSNYILFCDMFQFQYGTIKSVVSKKEGYIYPGFNSNMVRLKVTQKIK